MAKRKHTEGEPDSKVKRSRKTPAGPIGPTGWQTGELDIQIHKIKPPPLRTRVEKERKRHPSLTNVQIIHDVIARGGGCYALARKFLASNKIEPWLTYKKASHAGPSEPFSADGTITLPPKARVKVFRQILDSTRNDRPAITIEQLNSSLQAQVNGKNAGTRRTCEQAILELASVKSINDEAIAFLTNLFTYDAVLRQAYVDWHNEHDQRVEQETPQQKALPLAAQLKGLDDDWSDGADANAQDADSNAASVTSRSTAPSVGITNKGDYKVSDCRVNDYNVSDYKVTDYIGDIDTSHLPPPVRLSELNAKDRREQWQKWGISRDDDIVHCLRCGHQGHMASVCETIYPKKEPKCYRCRRRGHHETTCTFPPVVAGGFGDECDLCGNLGHGETQCSYLWYHPGFRQYTKKQSILRSEFRRRISCYNCGGAGHLGDDCPTLPDRIKAVLHFNNQWSEKHFRKWFHIIEDEDDGGRGSRALSEDGELAEARPSVPAYQMSQLGDYR